MRKMRFLGVAANQPYHLPPTLLLTVLSHSRRLARAVQVLFKVLKVISVVLTRCYVLARSRERARARTRARVLPRASQSSNLFIDFTRSWSHVLYTRCREVSPSRSLSKCDCFSQDHVVRLVSNPRDISRLV